MPTIIAASVLILTMSAGLLFGIRRLRGPGSPSALKNSQESVAYASLLMVVAAVWIAGPLGLRASVLAWAVLVAALGIVVSPGKNATFFDYISLSAVAAAGFVVVLAILYFGAYFLGVEGTLPSIDEQAGENLPSAFTALIQLEVIYIATTFAGAVAIVAKGRIENAALQIWEAKPKRWERLEKTVKAAGGVAAAIAGAILLSDIPW